MRLSFDLDGCLADTENPHLTALHGAVRAGHAGALDQMLQYYARRKLLLNPLQFTDVDDTFVIVTGRVPSSHEVTRRWVDHHLPSCEGLHLISDDEVETAFDKGLVEQGYQLLADKKLEALLELDVGVHFDNSVRIVNTLRDAGITAVLVGGGVL